MASQIITTHARTVSAIIGIILGNGNQTVNTICDWGVSHNDGPHYTMTRDRGINNKKLYRNIHTTYGWINNKVMGITNMSSFYTPTLHLVHRIIRKDPNFRMCTKLLGIIIDAKMWLRSCLPLTNLITQLCN